MIPEAPPASEGPPVPDVPPTNAPSWPPYCAGHATTQVALHANLYSHNTIPTFAWNPADPYNSSNFTAIMVLFTREGNPLTVDLTFRAEWDRIVSYHALVGHSELGNGLLEFDSDGALERVTEEGVFQLPGPNGLEGPIRIDFGTATSEGGTGLDGVTQTADPSNVSWQGQDGSAAVLGHACVDGALPHADDDTTPLPRTDVPEMCPARATTTVKLRANLAGTAYSTQFAVNDDTGMTAQLALDFSKLSANSWEYRVHLTSDVPGPELASGALSFDEQGVLTQARVETELALPTRNGSPGSVIHLDFGTPRAGDSGGVDGVTAFATSSTLVDARHDGHTLLLGSCTSAPSDFDARVPAPYTPVVHRTCADVISSYLRANVSLNPELPLAAGDWGGPAALGPADVCATGTVYDARMRALTIELCFRHVAEGSWDIHLQNTTIGAIAELARGHLDFAAGSEGFRASQTGDRSFALPLADGSFGPSVALDLGFPADESIGSGNVFEGTSGVRNLETDGLRKADCEAFPFP